MIHSLCLLILLSQSLRKRINGPYFKFKGIYFLKTTKSSSCFRKTTDMLVRICLSLVQWQLNAKAEGHKLSGAEYLEIPQHKIIAENIIANFKEAWMSCLDAVWRGKYSVAISISLLVCRRHSKIQHILNYDYLFFPVAAEDAKCTFYTHLNSTTCSQSADCDFISRDMHVQAESHRVTFSDMLPTIHM